MRWIERNRSRWAKKKDKDRKKKASCGAVSLVSTSADSVSSDWRRARNKEFLGSPKFFVPCSPPVRAHGLGFDLNLDKLTRRSGGGVRNTNMAGAAGGAASGSGL